MWVPDVLNRVLTGDGEGMTACDVIFDRLNQVGIAILFFKFIYSLIDRHLDATSPGVE